MKNTLLQPTADEIRTVLRNKPPDFWRIRGTMCDENGLRDDELDYHAASITVTTLKARERAAA